MEINGIINIYKEKGITSFKVVSQIRKIFNIKKVGHTGTLDPLAEGVLPVCIGKATRASDYIMNSRKVYDCEMQFGYETDTLDLEGKIVNSGINKEFSIDKVEEALKSFVGIIDQLPPLYSAIKINGKKLYQYARNNEKVTIKKRKVTIHKIVLKNVIDDKIRFIVECNKGTYIRSLCRDIAYKLDTYGTMTKLIRVSTGKFNVDNSYKIDEIVELTKKNEQFKILENVDKYIDLEVITLNKMQNENYLLGKKITFQKNSGLFLIKAPNEETIGIGIINESGQLKSKKRLT